MNDHETGRPSETQSPARRFMSVDALRGFDMFWIVGGEGIVHALKSLSHVRFFDVLSTQFRHKEWEGFAFYDVIFPLFIFIVGLSLVFSTTKALATKGKAAVVKRILIRSALLYLLGVFHSGGFAGEWHSYRLAGVLQQIAVSYLFASLLFCTMRVRALVATCLALLLGYWALMMFVPVPGVGAGGFEQWANLANYLDRQAFPTTRFAGGYLLGTLTSVATCLLGVFAGLLLKSTSVSDRKKVAWLLIGGIAGVGLGYLWGLQFPVIKKIWTSSYVLVAGGYSSLLLAAFYQVIEIWKFQRWATPFLWFGRNPITIYMADNVLDFRDIAGRLAGGPVKAALGSYGEMGIALTAMLLSTLIVRFLYRRRIFLRL